MIHRPLRPHCNEANPQVAEVHRAAPIQASRQNSTSYFRTAPKLIGREIGSAKAVGAFPGGFAFFSEPEFQRFLGTLEFLAGGQAGPAVMALGVDFFMQRIQVQLAGLGAGQTMPAGVFSILI